MKLFAFIIFFLSNILIAFSQSGNPVPAEIQLWLFTDFQKSTSPYSYGIFAFKKKEITTDLRFQYENSKTISINSGQSFYISAFDSLEILPQLGITIDKESFGANFTLTTNYAKGRFECYTQSLLTNCFNNDAFFFNWIEGSFYLSPEKIKIGIAEQVYVPFNADDGYKQFGFLVGCAIKKTVQPAVYIFSPFSHMRRVSVFVFIGF